MAAIGRQKFTYVCNYCNPANTFSVEKPEDLKNVMIRCPRCRNFLPKKSFKEVSAISKLTGLIKK